MGDLFWSIGRMLWLAITLDDPDQLVTLVIISGFYLNQQLVAVQSSGRACESYKFTLGLAKDSSLGSEAAIVSGLNKKPYKTIT